ncbi:LuxR C-terminal-related transcriptional regulator [Micromonospora sp. CPCC 205539]|uniref:response regulator transcription factor n=1 Tax=Micromonospora sp. CPCC 205539 TaxID=3122408 RepID=UPI002FEF27B0
MDNNRAQQSPDENDAALDIALCVEGEVLSKGLEVLLSHVRNVGHVYRLVDSEDLGPLLASHPCDVVIVSVEQWSALDEKPTIAGGDLPRILVAGDEARIRKAFKSASATADGFVYITDLSAESLNDSLSRTVSGMMPMPPSLARQLLTGARRIGHGRESRPVSLTFRESEALVLLADGLSNKQIARALSISTHGAKRLVGAVLLKLGAPNRTAAVVTAMKSGLV